MGQHQSTESIDDFEFTLKNDTYYSARVTYQDNEFDNIAVNDEKTIKGKIPVLIELRGIPGEKKVQNDFGMAAMRAKLEAFGEPANIDVAMRLAAAESRKIIEKMKEDLNTGAGKTRRLSVFFKSELEMIKEYHASATVYSVTGDWQFLINLEADGTEFKESGDTTMSDSNTQTDSTELTTKFQGVFKAITLNAEFKNSTTSTSLKLNEQKTHKGKTKTYNSPKDIYQEVLHVKSSIGNYTITTPRIVAMERGLKPKDELFIYFKKQQ